MNDKSKFEDSKQGRLDYLISLQLDDEGIGRSFDAHSLDRFDHLVLLRTLVAVLAVEHLTCRESLQGPLNAVRP